MACDVYFGDPPVAQGAGYTKPPRPNPTYANPSIAVSDIVSGTAIARDANGFVDVSSGQYQVAVNLYNAGSDDAPSATVELWWAQPSTATPLATIAMATAVGATQGVVPAASTFSAPFSTNWTVDTTNAGGTNLLSVNGGHVCLWAQASSNQATAACNSFSFNPADPFNDWFSAVQNVLISATGMKKKGRWSFGFVAGNGSRFGGENILVARAYDPRVDADKERLLGLLSMQRVRSKLGRCVRFGVPASVSVGLGTETLQGARTLPRKGVPPAAAIGNLGPLAHDLAAHLLADRVHHAAGDRPAEYRAKLASGQIHQAVVQVEPQGDAGEVHAIEVSQVVQAPQGPVPVGGLVVLFAPHCAI
jgi:hypothetical protein